MLLIETERCQDCKHFEEGDEFARCKNDYINDEKPQGEFNYFYADVLNCSCVCQFFAAKGGGEL